MKHKVMPSGVFAETTHSVKITVVPTYLEEQSIPKDDYFVWAYHITIENYSDKTLQLMERHWKVIDAMGHVQEVHGAGVVGEQPILEPKGRFSYSSGTHLHTSSGMMMGSYEMEFLDDKERITVTVPAFSLDSPHEIAKLN